MISSSDYLSIISEYYDLSDSYTMNKVVFCNEAQKQSVIEHLTNKLYNNIKGRVDDIDFGTIPQSKGDITKIDNYQNLVDCISTISSLIREYGQPTTQVDVASTALSNIQSRTRLWQKGFALNTEFPMIMYNTMTLSVVASISLLITTCIEYIKDGSDTIKTAFDKAAYAKTKEHVLFKSLQDFNTSCAKGDVDRLVSACLKNNLVKVKEAYEAGNDGTLTMLTVSKIQPIDEDGAEIAIAIGVVVTGLLNAKAIIDLIFKGIRNVVYFFFYSRQKAADYFTTEADFLQINAENLKYREGLSDNEEKRKQVYNRQMKWVERFRKWANFFMIKDKKAQADAKKDSDEDDKKGKYDDQDNDEGSDDNDDGSLF